MSIYALENVYSLEKINYQKNRYNKLSDNFKKVYGIKPERFFSAPGRTEICGNHTDHQNGKVLAASISLDIIAAVARTDDNTIYIKSEGYEPDVLDLSDLSVNKEEKNTSKALIKGVLRGFVDRNCKIGGFKAYTLSNVLKGSGMSSSAAFEVLIGTVINGLYNDFSVSNVEISKIAQFAENVYFGKPSGLMDQIASSVGGLIAIDFKNPKNPDIENIDFDFNSTGHYLCIVDTKGSHANLTSEYATISTEMKDIASFFNVDCLRMISKSDIIQNYSELRKKFGDRAVLRALHYMDCNIRVDKECKALKNNDVQEFLDLVNESGDSSCKYLQNIFSPASPSQQGLSTAFYLAKEVLVNSGAYRVHGGGFAGTIQAFVPADKLSEFTKRMESVFGTGACIVPDIRSVGGTEIKLPDT